MRLDILVYFSTGLSDGELHVGFVHSVSDDGTGAGMVASGVAWKNPGPIPRELAARVFGGQAAGQFQGHSVSDIPFPGYSGGFELVEDGLAKADR